MEWTGVEVKTSKSWLDMKIWMSFLMEMEKSCSWLWNSYWSSNGNECDFSKTGERIIEYLLH